MTSIAIGALPFAVFGAILMIGYVVIGHTKPKAAREAARRWHKNVASGLGIDDPVEQRCRSVADEYVRGEFGHEELDWRMLVALQPPESMPRQRHEKALREAMAEPVGTAIEARVVPFVDTSSYMATATHHRKAWKLPEPIHSYPIPPIRAEEARARMAEGEHCSFRDLHSDSGYMATVCACGHDMNRHYNGGCNDCDVARREAFADAEWKRINGDALPTEPDPRLVERRAIP